MANPAEVDDAYKTLLWVGAGAAVATYVLTGAFIYTRPNELVMLGGRTVGISQSQVQAILSLLASLIIPRLLARYPAVLEWLKNLIPKAPPAPEPQPAGPHPVQSQLDRIERQVAEIHARVTGPETQP